MNEFKTVAQQVQAQGWTVIRGRKHLKLQSPSGKRRMTVARTPSDWRAAKNLRAFLRRIGILERSKGA